MRGHSDRAHAKLSASGSARWLACPGSVRLEEQFPDRTSEYAEEGTAAHELAELMLRHKLHEIAEEDYRRHLETFKTGKYYSHEMFECCETYSDIVLERVNAAKALTADTQVLLEQRLDFSPWVPGGFGTGDVVIISEASIEVIDFKFGKGVPVSAWDNSQMRLYALGAYNTYGYIFGPEIVTMTIIQPRLDNISEDIITIDELLDWAENTVKPRAEEALSDSGELKAGEHCKFCKAKAVCKTRAEANLALAKYEFQDPELLTVEEIGEVLAQADELKAWVSDVEKYALDQAYNHGLTIPGWKLVEGRSVRRFKDPDAVAKVLLSQGYNSEEIYKRDLKGITDLQKMLGKKKFESLLSDYIIKPPGKPKLAMESDNRPEISTAAIAAEEFKNIKGD